MIHQVNVRPQRERRVRVPEPLGDLANVLAALEQKRRAGVAEGVEADRRDTGPLGSRIKHPPHVSVRIARAGAGRKKARSSTTWASTGPPRAAMVSASARSRRSRAAPGPCGSTAMSDRRRRRNSAGASTTGSGAGRSRRRLAIRPPLGSAISAVPPRVGGPTRPLTGGRLRALGGVGNIQLTEQASKSKAALSKFGRRCVQATLAGGTGDDEPVLGDSNI